MQAPAIKIPGPRLRLRPDAEREAEVAIERQRVGGHPPAQPDAMEHPFIGRDIEQERRQKTKPA